MSHSPLISYLEHLIIIKKAKTYFLEQIPIQSLELLKRNSKSSSVTNVNTIVEKLVLLTLSTCRSQENIHILHL